MTTLSTFSEMLKLYLAGYRFRRVLTQDLLEILLKKQNHTPEGEKKLREIWPEKVRLDQLADEQARALALEELPIRMENAMKCTKLLDLVQKSGEPWSGGYFSVPVNFGPVPDSSDQ